MADLIKLDMTQIWATTGDKTTPSDAKINEGWVVEAVPRQTWNWMQNRVDQNVAYLLQKGIPEWDSTTEFQSNRSYVQRNGIVYLCLQTAIGQDPSTASSNYWKRAFVDYSTGLDYLRTVTPAANTLPYYDTSTSAKGTVLTAFGRSLLDDVDASAGRTTLNAQQLNNNLTGLSGVVSANNTFAYFVSDTGQMASTGLTGFARTLLTGVDAASLRNTLGLGNSSVLDVGNVAGTIAAGDDTRIVNALQKANNLSDVTNITIARANLGLGNAAQATITTTATDSAQGRLVKVGDYGWNGGSADPVNTNIDLNTLKTAAVSYVSGFVGTNGPVGTVTPTNFYIRVTKFNTLIKQEVLGHADDTYFVRSFDGTNWTAWKEMASASSKANITSPTFLGDPRAPTPALGDNDTSIATTAFVANTFASVNFAANRNLIINGNFDVWQRRTSQTTSGYDSDDRWSNGHTGSTKTHSLQTFADGQTDVPTNPTYYSRTVVNSVIGSTNGVTKTQPIENVRLLSGKTVTLSFYAKADSAKNIAIEFRQRFGIASGGSPDVTGIGYQLIALTTTWKKYTVTVTLPSVAGKTIIGGIAPTLLVFWFDSGSANIASTLGQQSGTFDLSSIKLELGNVATAWDNRSLAEELALCQRFFETYVGTVSTNQPTFFNQYYKVLKRSVPSLTLISGQFGGASIDNSSMAGFRLNGAPSGNYDYALYIDSEL